MNPSDQDARERFAHETERNFSIIAPAGSGKTHAIAGRILEMARVDARRLESHDRNTRLPTLAVVTYTRKAAEEMRDRARRGIVEAGLPPRVLGLFNEAFFGTIHSFCFDLLRRYGPLAGLPPKPKLEMDDGVLRLAFQRDMSDVSVFLPASARAAWRVYGCERDIWKLAWDFPLSAPMPQPPGKCPVPDIATLSSFTPKRKHAVSDKNTCEELLRLQRWSNEAQSGGRALDVPVVEKGHGDFKVLANEILLPLRRWLAAAEAHAAARLAQTYADFKESRGLLGYGDLGRLAQRLLRDPVMAARIRARRYSILLDEAQDTDPVLFSVLLGVAQPENATGLWLDGAGAPPAPGRLSMVGDPQQAIYDHADLECYLEAHDRLVRENAAEKLTFSVTWRCDEKVVVSANEVFPRLLDGLGGQATYVPLQARPGAGKGGVWRLPIERPANFEDKPKTAERLRAEAAALALWLKQAGIKGLGVEDWSKVAVLSPRRGPEWLGAIAGELRRVGLRAQLHSGDPMPGDEPARAWLGALTGLMADPADVFECAGVLREIFGISDDELFHMCRMDGARPGKGAAHPLSLEADNQKLKGPGGEALALLCKLRKAIEGKPLRDAVAHIVSATMLRERLDALRKAGVGGLDDTSLDALLDRAAVAEARGEMLVDFARSLMGGESEPVALEPRAGEVQLLTCHKSKGLEWDVVVLFGLFQEERFPTAEYPQWLQAEKSGTPPVCLHDKIHAQAEDEKTAWKPVRDEARYAKSERLLYVSATRAKRALVLSDAEALGADDDSLADRLQLLPGGAARGWWESLPLAKKDLKLDKPEILANANAGENLNGWPEAKLSSGQTHVARALKRAGVFARRVLPSSLATHTVVVRERDEPDLFSPPDFPEAQPPASSATAYGNAWHALMEDTPWAGGPNAWQAYWTKRFDAMPEPERARAEVALLLKSSLAKRLAAPGLEFATEIPFLWPKPGGKMAFDGCIDLVVRDPQTGRWLIVDWKTDLVGTTNPGAELLARYGEQVGAYARVFASVFGGEVEALLYSTRTGKTATL